MAVTDIKLLRKASGQSHYDGADYTLYYKVTTDNVQTGPSQILANFPVGAPYGWYQSNNYQKYIDSLAPGIAPPFIVWPWPDGRCDGGAWGQSGRDYNWLAIMKSATIVSRELSDKSSLIWIVACEYEDTAQTEGPLSPPTIVPYYQYEDKVQMFGTFRGWYRRDVKESTDTAECENQPGSWKEFDGGGALETSKTTDTSSTTIVPIINTAGFPVSEPLVQKVGIPTYRVSWFSFTALDFSCAIGRVNENEYKMEFWSGEYLAQPVAGDDIGQGISALKTPLKTFCKKFKKRELLVNDVQVDPVKWGGANCFRYTVELVFDPLGHDKYVLDSGYSFLSRPNKDESSSGEKPSSEDVKGSTNESQTSVGTDGLTITEEQLMDGSGGKLVKYDANGELVEENSPDKAVWLRYRVHEEVKFPEDSLTTDKQYHIFDRNLKFPFKMDGGYRFQESTSTDPAWDCDKEEEEP
jgi:hypothetical protein